MNLFYKYDILIVQYAQGGDFNAKIFSFHF